MKQVVFSMDTASALCLDGFKGLIFRYSWDIIGEDVVSAILEFISTSHILPCLNSNFPVLVLKSFAAKFVD